MFPTGLMAGIRRKMGWQNMSWTDWGLSVQCVRIVEPARAPVASGQVLRVLTRGPAIQTASQFTESQRLVVIDPLERCVLR